LLVGNVRILETDEMALITVLVGSGSTLNPSKPGSKLFRDDSVEAPTDEVCACPAAVLRQFRATAITIAAIGRGNLSRIPPSPGSGLTEARPDRGIYACRRYRLACGISKMNSIDICALASLTKAAEDSNVLVYSCTAAMEY
jgi:hypothetical protein